MTPRNTALASLLTAFLLLVTSAPVQADHEPAHTVKQVVDSIAAPPGVPLGAVIHILGDGYSVTSVYTSPGLACTIDDDPFAGSIDVECHPAVRGDWTCLGPAVMVAVMEGDYGSVTGYAGCADTTQTCTGYGWSRFPDVLPSCIGFGLAVQEFPVRCGADYRGADGLGEWQVSCTNGDP